MCGPTSETQDRVIEQLMIRGGDHVMAQEPFIRAELDYRLERARSQFGRSRTRQHRVPRRLSLA
jgi:hypothetical protein